MEKSVGKSIHYVFVCEQYGQMICRHICSPKSQQVHSRRSRFVRFRLEEQGGVMESRSRQCLVSLGVGMMCALLAMSNTVSAQAAIVTGRVVDSATTAPIPFAQVRIVGTDRAVISGEDGRFTLSNVKSGAYQLRALRIGYRAATQSVTLTEGTTTTVDFALAPTVQTLDQVVTTATGGTERKRENGASIGVVQVDSLALAAIATPSDVLEARIPGVSVETGTGTTGASSRIRIRGSNSISLSNDPLIIVDGIRVDNATNSTSGDGASGEPGPSRLNDFNPDDIADIQVIKGPAAAALYGTAAANGVIQITTKRGQQGKTRFEVYGEAGSLQQVTRFPSNYSQIGTTPDGTRVAGCSIVFQAGGLCTAVADSLVSFNPLETVSPFVTGNRMNYGLSASGGNASTTYYLGGSYEREQGVYETNKLRNVNVRSTLHSQLTTNFDVTLNTGYVDGKLTRPQGGDFNTSIISGGLFGSAFDDSVNRGYLFATPTKIEQIKTQQDLRHFTGGLTANYLPIRWLTLTGVGGLDYVHQLDEVFVPPGVFDPVTQSPDLAEGEIALDPYDIFNYTANGTAVARYALKPLHAQASTSVGVQFNRYRLAGSRAFGQKLAPGTESLAGATSLFAVDETNQGLATLGYLAQEQLTWRDRIFLTGAVRTDRTSAFGTNFKRVYYPAGSLSWVIGEEPFFPKSSVVSSLRLRTAYGSSGQNPEFRQAITYFNPTSVALGGVDVPGVSIGGTGNPDLKPEKSNEFEAGFDAGLFRDRVNMEFTYYHKITVDALVAQNLPPSLGTSQQRFINIGRVRNAGLELLLHGRPVDTHAVTVDLTLNGTTLQNKLENLGAGISPILQLLGYQRLQTGYPLGAYFGQTLQSFSDANHDGLIDPSEVTLSDSAVFIGTPFATRTLAVSPEITLFKIVRVSALFDYRGGQKLWDLNAGVRCGGFQTCRAIQDRNAPLADQAAAVATTLGTFAPFIEDASFTKLREVAVRISLPASVAQRVGATGATLTLAGRNLHTWTNYKGTDPETQLFNVGALAVDLESTPQVRRYTARIDLTW